MQEERPTDDRAPAIRSNPLVEGLERLPVHPTTLVIFGATGDLAKRKLLPALYNLAHEGALPERFDLVGTSRSEMSRRRVPPAGDRGDARSSRAARPTRRCSPSCFAERALRRRARSTTTTSTSGSREVLDELDDERRPAAQPLLLPVDRAGVLPDHRRAARRHEPRPPRGRRGARHHREAVRTTLEEAQALNAPRAVGLRRGPGLPDRPLPRQGDGPEHPGVPLREHAVRAVLEPQLHRQRPDHGRRGHRHRHARRLLRHAPARCATSSRTTCSSCLRCCAMEPPVALRRPTRSATRRSRCCGAIRAPTRPRSPEMAVRAQYARGHRGGEEVPGYLDEDGRAGRTRRPRRTPRCASRSTTGAGPACRSTCARASAWRARSPRSR